MARSDAEKLLEEGTTLSQRALLSEAIQVYARAAEADPSWALPLLNLGVAHLQRGEPSLAVATFQRGLPLAASNEERALFLSNLGQAYYKSGNLELAVATYERSLVLLEAPTTWVETALAWHDLGQNDKAIACLNAYLRNPVEELYPVRQVRALRESYSKHTVPGRPSTGCLAAVAALGVVLAVVVSCILA